MLHANTWSPDLYWKIQYTGRTQEPPDPSRTMPKEFWHPWKGQTQCYTGSQYPTQPQGNVHPCKLKNSQNTDSFNHWGTIKMSFFQPNHNYFVTPNNLWSGSYYKYKFFAGKTFKAKYFLIISLPFTITIFTCCLQRIQMEESMRLICDE